MMGGRQTAGARPFKFFLFPSSWLECRSASWSCSSCTVTLKTHTAQHTEYAKAETGGSGVPADLTSEEDYWKLISIINVGVNL